MGKKLFGNTGNRRYSSNQRARAKSQRSAGDKPQKKTGKKSIGLKILIWILAFVLFVECAYCVAIFTDIGPLPKLRQIWISTAWSTMNHRWLATALIPGDIVQPVIEQIEAGQDAQMNIESSWGSVDEQTEPTQPRSPSVGFSKDQAAAILADLAQSSGLSGAAADFFEVFHELDEESVYEFVEKHPEAIENGWDKFYVNEAGLDDEGTSMKTNQGDQVLAINAEHGLLAIRIIDGINYRGVLVIGKDPSRVKCAPSSQLGSVGQRVGEIGEKNDALVAMTASGFDDSEGLAEGAVITGAAMHSGKATGYHYPWGYKRIELHEDNRLYITDAHRGFMDGCTDASEFTPALIVDGKIVVSGSDGYTAINPRCAFGQTSDEAIMFLAIEGRRVGTSLGTDANTLADILAEYDCYQAMNVDGGTSGMLWYEGEYITLCSNKSLPEGRRLPNAWVYCKETVPDPE